MPSQQSNPLEVFTTPYLTLALGVGAVMVGGIAVWFMVAQDDLLTGSILALVAITDVALILGSRMLRARGQRQREESGVIEPMENRPPT